MSGEPAHLGRGTDVNDPDGDALRSRSKLRFFLSTLIVGLGIVWVVFIAAKELPELSSTARVANWTLLALSLIIGVGAQFVIAAIFRILVGQHNQTSISFIYAARLTFVAQILRHIPGRIWGVVYLVSVARGHIATAAMIRANIDLMLLSLAFSLLVAAALTIDSFYGPWAATGFFSCGLLIAVTAIRSDVIQRTMTLATSVIPRLREKLMKAVASHHRLSWRGALQIAVAFVVVWVLYLAVWWMLPIIFPVLGHADIWLLCAAYLAAWVIGYLAMVTPGGLGVREAGFIAFSSPLESLATLTFLALFIRIWQIVVEMVVFLMFAMLKSQEERGGGYGRARSGG
jgi:hypothetical protein